MVSVIVLATGEKHARAPAEAELLLLPLEEC